MSRRTAKPCAEPGCAALVYGERHCAVHAKASTQASEARRTRDQPWRRWYWTARWRAIAAAQLRAYPCCALCERRGIVTVAKVCDHIVPHRGNEHLFWFGARQSMCKHCHDSSKQAEEAAERRHM